MKETMRLLRAARYSKEDPFLFPFGILALFPSFRVLAATSTLRSSRDEDPRGHVSSVLKTYLCHLYATPKPRYQPHHKF
jgi:hypothetical protein